MLNIPGPKLNVQGFACPNQSVLHFIGIKREPTIFNVKSMVKNAYASVARMLIPQFIPVKMWLITEQLFQTATVGRWPAIK